MQSQGQRPGQGNRTQPGNPSAGGSSLGQFLASRNGSDGGREASRTQTHAERPEFLNAFARIKVIGVGGAGGNAINRMVQSGVEGIEFVAVNTDAQALLSSEASIAVRIGDKLTKGLGAGGRPEVGARAAEESADSLLELMRDTDMVFITAGMGGGTGTGASPVIAKIAKSAGALTVGVVTRPFEFEGARRRRSADEGIGALRDCVDALITIPNERLIHMVDPKTPITEAFRIADDVLRQGIAGISDLIIKPGIINLDFADVRTIMRDAGSALMAIGRGSGETRCIDAAKEAIESPLLETSIQGATGVLYNIAGGTSLTLLETSEAAEIIRAAVDEEAEIIYGTSIDDTLGDNIRITLIATGFEDRGQGYDQAPRRMHQPQRQPQQPPVRERDRDRERDYDRDRDRDRDRERVYRVQERPAARQAQNGPVMPDDDWEGESSIIRFLRER
jgi:cell division protein FtsZ